MSEKDKLDILLYNLYSNVKNDSNFRSQLELIANCYKVSID